MGESSLDAATLMDRMYRHQRHIYDLTRKFYLLGRDSLILDLSPPSGGDVLEIGCGTGRNLILAARRYPEARFFGLDISSAMLTTARGEILRGRLGEQVRVAQADATAFDARALFGVARFDRVFVSYALSMIPPWREVLPRALAAVKPGGDLRIVDFGDFGELPGFFRSGLKAWLAAFDVHPREGLEAELAAFAARHGLRPEFRPLYKRYAFLARLEAPARERCSTRR
jgi:S-adenosylmethionine-diacylgycerolhomoserine-N-methlytransferase